MGAIRGNGYGGGKADGVKASASAQAQCPAFPLAIRSLVIVGHTRTLPSVEGVMTQIMDVDTTIALGRLFCRVKEKVVETYKTLGERMPDDDLISLTLVTLYEEGYTDPAELEDATLTRLRPIRTKGVE